MKLGRDLKVRYVLEGSIQRSDDRLRVTAQLIDTESGTLIWADRFDRRWPTSFLVQDDIVSQIVGKIAGGYGVINAAKSGNRKALNEIQAYDLVLRAPNEILVEYNSETIRSAIKSLRQAIALDPLNARARREMAWLGVIGWVFRFRATPPLPHEIFDKQPAVQLDPPTHARGWWPPPHSFSTSGWIFSSMKRGGLWHLPPMMPLFASRGHDR